MQVAMRLDALDVAAQSCERVHARAGHAPLPLLMMAAIWLRQENQWLAQLFMICSNIKLTAPEESIRIGLQAIHE
jgi:hypothetical protein